MIRLPQLAHVTLLTSNLPPSPIKIKSLDCVLCLETTPRQTQEYAKTYGK